MQRPSQLRGSLERFARANPLPLFFTTAYLWTWTVWLAVPRVVRQHPLGWKFDSFDISIIIIGAFGPTIGALVTQWLGHHNLKICAVWTGWRSMLTAFAIGLTLFFIATVIAPSVAVAKAPFYAFHWTALAQLGTYGANYSTFIGGPVNEEPGWRGFALPKMQLRFGPVLGSVILGLVWAAWHAPMFLIPGWSTNSPWEYCLTLIGVSFLLTLASNLARFSVIIAILLHAFFNISSRVLGALLAGLPTRDHDNLIYSIIVFACGLAVALATFGRMNHRSAKTNDGINT